MEIAQYSILAGALLSLIFAYVPGLKSWYEKLSAEYKQLVMLGALFVIVGGKFALGCIGRDATFTCDANGVYDALTAFILAISANAGVYKGTEYVRTGKGKGRPGWTVEE